MLRALGILKIVAALSMVTAHADLKSEMKAGNYRAALSTYLNENANSAWAQSDNGEATLAYLLYQNGMQASGLQMLISKTQPNRLDPQLLNTWTVEIKRSKWIQKGWIQTSGWWKSIHNNENVSLTIKNKRDIDQAFAKANALPKDNISQKTRIWWQIATKAPVINETSASLRALKLMKESGQTIIAQDQLASTQARVLYQRGELKAALDFFHQIPKSSALWVESVEERAWAHLKGDDFDKAMGESVTLLSPALTPLVGPESYYLANLMSLKACDYPRIFKNSELFKTRYKDRLAGLQALANTGANANLPAVLERLEKGGVSIESAGSLVEWLPRAAFRDQKFLRYMETRRALLNDSARSSEYAPHLENVRAENRGQADRMRTLALQRLRTLATAEVAEYRQILNKLHIVEGEVIQRLAMDDRLKGERSKLAKVEDTGDVLVFPYKGEEVWFDELDNYKARVKDCPTLKGASL